VDVGAVEAVDVGVGVGVVVGVDAEVGAVAVAAAVISRRRRRRRNKRIGKDDERKRVERKRVVIPRSSRVRRADFQTL
jgi:hypothetical protein